MSDRAVWTRLAKPPVLGRGPFGQAIRIRQESDATFRPTLVVPRARLHNSRIDVKGAGQSVTVVAMVFDNRKNTVTSYLNGVGGDHWIEGDLQKHQFWRWPAQAWPKLYNPPQRFVKTKDGKLMALKLNPYYFPHDLFTPEAAERGGPFTITRVIHLGARWASRVGSAAWRFLIVPYRRSKSPGCQRWRARRFPCGSYRANTQRLSRRVRAQRPPPPAGSHRGVRLGGSPLPRL
jgi:hypothetical protein